MSEYLPYTAENVASLLHTRQLGRRIEHHPQVGSTNDLVREAARRGEPEGLVIIADEQIKGRGRLGRTWTAPPGCCVLCSVLLRPRFSTQKAFYLTIATSLAIYRACKTVIGEDDNLEPPTITIKWPNDVLIKGKKVAGVLCESEFGHKSWAFCVVGFGINVNINPDGLGALGSNATSLSAELGYSVDRTTLLATVLKELEAIYTLLKGDHFSPVFDEWASALDTIGKRISVNETSGILSGQALRVDAGGALIVRLDSGEEKRVLAGDVLTQPRFS